MNKVKVMFAVILLSLAGCASGEYKKAIVEYEKKSKEGYIKASEFLNDIDRSSFSYKINSGKIEELRKKVKEEYREKMRNELFLRYADTWIVYTKDDSFYISKFDGSEKRFLIGKNDDKEVQYANWSPNGKYLGIIISKKYEEEGKLYIIDFGKENKSDKTMKGIKVISIDTPYGGYFSWAPDSSKIAYVATNHANGELTVYAYEIGSKKAKIYFSKAGKNESKLMNFGGYETINYAFYLKNSRDLIL